MCNFPRWNFQDYPYRSARPPSRFWHILAVALGLQCSLWRLRWPNLAFGKLPLYKLRIWEVSTWEVALGKMSLGKYQLHQFIMPNRYWDLKSLINKTKTIWISNPKNGGRGVWEKYFFLFMRLINIFEQLPIIGFGNRIFKNDFMSTIHNWIGKMSSKKFRFTT